MTRSIDLNPEQRNDLLDRYRNDPDPEVRFRSHILLLLDDGHTWATVAAILFCSSRTIDRWVKRFGAEGVESVAGHKPGRPFRLAADWVGVAVEWVTTKTPRDFGFLRSRWCCEAVAILIRQIHHIEVGRETVRRWLHRGDLVYRRPRPVVGPKDPDLLRNAIISTNPVRPVRLAVSTSMNTRATSRLFASAYPWRSLIWDGIEKPSFSCSLDETRA